MRFCAHCGAPLKEDAAFCPACGAPAEVPGGGTVQADPAQPATPADRPKPPAQPVYQTQTAPSHDRQAAPRSGLRRGPLAAGIVCLAAAILAFVKPAIIPYSLPVGIALAVLGYLGVSMLVAGIRNSSESVDLGGMKNLCVAAVATSVDAIAVGVSLAMGDTGFADAFLATVLTFAITVIACVFGITAGAATGRIFGNAARIAGGLVLIFIGLKPFFS